MDVSLREVIEQVTVRTAQNIRIAALMCALVTLAVTTLGYREAQLGLVREANSLYSSAAVAVSGDVATAWARAEAENLDIQLFLTPASEPNVRAVVTTSGNLDSFPQRETRWRVSPARPGALAGSAVAVGTNRVDAFGQEYKISGLLGAGERSLLAHQVLVFDPLLFERAPTGEFVIDGPDAAKLAGSFRSARPAGEGFNRRTNLDFVSPIIVGMSTIAVTGGSAILGALAMRLGAWRYRIERFWGRSRASVLFRQITHNAALWLGASIAALIALEVTPVLGPTATRSVQTSFPMVSAVLFTLFLVGFWLASRQERSLR